MNEGGSSLSEETSNQTPTTRYRVFVFDRDCSPQYIAAIDEVAAQKEYAEMFTSDSVDCLEITDDMLDRLKVTLTDENDGLTGEELSMRKYLVDMSDKETADAFFLCGYE